jgi:hypothetical protein
MAARTGWLQAVSVSARQLAKSSNASTKAIAGSATGLRPFLHMAPRTGWLQAETSAALTVLSVEIGAGFRTEVAAADSAEVAAADSAEVAAAGVAVADAADSRD